MLGDNGDFIRIYDHRQGKIVKVFGEFEYRGTHCKFCEYLFVCSKKPGMESVKWSSDGEIIGAASFAGAVFVVDFRSDALLFTDVMKCTGGNYSFAIILSFFLNREGKEHLLFKLKIKHAFSSFSR